MIPSIPVNASHHGNQYIIVISGSDNAVLSMKFGTILRFILSTHDERGRKTSDWFRMLVRRKVRRMVSKDRGPFLDAGGGDGLLFDPNVCRLAEMTTILDTDRNALLDARKSYGNKGMFVTGDVTQMPFPDSTFTTSVCIGTFINFSSVTMVQRSLIECARVTKPDGRVITEFRNADNPFVSLAFRHADIYDSSLDGLPLRAYSLSQIKDMISRAGLEVRRIKIIGIPVKPLIFSYIIEAGYTSSGRTS